MVKVKRISRNKARKINCSSFSKRPVVGILNKKKRIMSTMPWSLLVWSLALFHVMNCCDWVLAMDDMEAAGRVTEDGESEELNYDNGGESNNLKWPLFNWSQTHQPREYSGNILNEWLRFPAPSPFMVKNKRAVYGILGLATKRPHKTAGEIQHLPPQDAFMSVRGRKKRSVVRLPSSLVPSFATFTLRRRPYALRNQSPQIQYSVGLSRRRFQ